MGPSAKKILPLAVVLAVAVGVFVGVRVRQPVRPNGEPAPTGTNSSAISTKTSPAISPGAGSQASSSQGAVQGAVQSGAVPGQLALKPETPFALGSADTPPPMDPATVLEKMRIAINNYQSMFKENPVGTNPEITAELNGGNPKSVKFITEEAGLRINGRGELVDYWGTPFFFHQLSGTDMEIRSAGPDKTMWTADDVVTK